MKAVYSVLGWNEKYPAEESGAASSGGPRIARRPDRIGIYLIGMQDESAK